MSNGSNTTYDNARSTGALTRYSDVLLAAGVVAILALMVLPLTPTFIDLLVSVNICSGIGLLLIGIYISSPVAFSSFPSVLLIYTLFRLSLSIATTRLILIEGNAGHVIDTFGNIVAGGDLIIGLVVFLIITIVQFIVVAKGAERVAEVAARFTLDAMPGKQLSIDSDLRAGLIDKDEAKRRRKHLEIESQLHGSLDGAMKFVKGDSIAGIVIICVNLVGGLLVGSLSHGMTLADAMHHYSILTIGDGLVTQIPALLGAIASGLIVTRTAGDDQDKHLGEAIARQVLSQQRVMFVAGGIALFFALVPGFPWAIFIGLGLALLASGYFQSGRKFKDIPRWVMNRDERDADTRRFERVMELAPAAAIQLDLAPPLRQTLGPKELERVLRTVKAEMFQRLGLAIPQVQVEFAPELGDDGFRIALYGVPTAGGRLQAQLRLLDTRRADAIAPRDAIVAESGVANLSFVWVRGESANAEERARSLDTADALAWIVLAVLERSASQFLGIQDVNAILARMNAEYPDLAKEVLRVIPLQRLADVMKRLVDERVSIRDVRDIFEALAEAGQREKDAGLLCEYARIGLRRHLCHALARADRTIRVAVARPELEEAITQSIRVNGTTHLALDPEVARNVLDRIRALRTAQRGERFGLLASFEVRRFLRKLVENEFPDLMVLSYHELVPDVRVEAIDHLGIDAAVGPHASDDDAAAYAAGSVGADEAGAARGPARLH